jgi:hypothetical protein
MAISGVTLRKNLSDKLSIEQMDGNFSAITSSIEFRATTGSNTFIGNQTITGSIVVTGSFQSTTSASFNTIVEITGSTAGIILNSGDNHRALQLGSVTASNYATDYTAEGQGVPLGGVYHTDGYLKIRTSDTDRTAFNLSSISASNYANDAAAAAGNINLGGMYHTNGTLKIRLV